MTFKLSSEDTGPNHHNRRQSKNQLIFKALCDATGVDPGRLTRAEGKRIGTAASQLVEVGATPGQVASAAVEYRRKFPRATITAFAIASHWSSLTPQPSPDPSGPSQYERAMLQAHGPNWRDL